MQYVRRSWYFCEIASWVQDIVAVIVEGYLVYRGYPALKKFLFTFRFSHSGRTFIFLSVCHEGVWCAQCDQGHPRNPPSASMIGEPILFQEIRKCCASGNVPVSVHSGHFGEQCLSLSLSVTNNCVTILPVYPFVVLHRLPITRFHFPLMMSRRGASENVTTSEFHWGCYVNEDTSIQPCTRYSRVPLRLNNRRRGYRTAESQKKPKWWFSWK